MSFVRALLRKGLFGVMLAYGLAAQAMLAGPSLVAPLAAAHELCLTGEAAPHDDLHHSGGACCLGASAFQAATLGPVPMGTAVTMRDAVPALYAPALMLSGEGHGPDDPAARGPPSRLV